MPDLKGDLNETLGGWPVLLETFWNNTNFDWKDLNYKLHKKGFSTGAFFDLGVSEDLRDNLKRQIYVRQSYQKSENEI